MVDATKIKDGTFTSSYTAPKKRRLNKIIIIFIAIGLIVGVSGWLLWRNEMSKRLDEDAYNQALKTSEGKSFTYLTDVERNARFQKHSGITMDAYLKSPRSIRSSDDKFACAQLLDGSFHYAESAAIYKELIKDPELTPETLGTYLEAAMASAVGANDKATYDVARARYDSYLKTGDFADDYRKQKQEMYRWYDEK